MNGMKRMVILGMAIVSATSGAMGDEYDIQRVKAAQAFRAKGEAVSAAPDGTLFCEAEEFKVESPGWQAGYWGQNYYAATFANTFLSRKAFLGAPEQCEDTVASINVNVPAAGRYLVLARYEAAYRFETQFRIRVEQGGKSKLDRPYGARNNIKIWAFGKRLATEVAWDWGAVENVVWEGHDAYADLDAGPAKISITAGKQPAPAARRNIDLIMLTTDEGQVQERIQKEAYLPLDGWLTQSGDVFVRVINGGGGPVTVKSMSFNGNGPMQEHSPYWVHMRRWKPVNITAAPGQTTEWIDIGGTMDTLNDGQWGFNVSGSCKLEFGAITAAGKIESIRTMDAGGQLPLVSFADVRYSRKIQTPGEANQDLVKHLTAMPSHGKPVEKTRIYAMSALPGDISSLFSLSVPDVAGGYADWRRRGPAELEAECMKLSESQRNNMFVISLGDEITLPTPNAATAKEGFVAFLKSSGVSPKDVDPASGGDWTNIVFSLDTKLRTGKPGLYFWSHRYLNYYGIQGQKALTDAIRKHLPNAHIGANFSPHHGGGEFTQLGEVFKWVGCFRQDGMTLPWAEDYIWQVPVGSPQMNGINLDYFRAGNRGKTGRKIMYYVMPHAPGNTPAMWRRLFHNAVGHGATILNLFEFDPVWLAYTENHVTGNDMYATVLRAIREFSLYEDIVQTGYVRPAQTALWFSENSDIWHDGDNSFGAAKRALYVAILGRQLPLDFVVDQDAADGTLDKYRVLYLSDRHVSRESSDKIAAWVKNGGKLFATAGAGMFDEYDQPNKALRTLLGVEQTSLTMPADAQVSFIKQDLPFVKSLGDATLDGQAGGLPVFGAISKVKTSQGATVKGTFADGSPAVVANKPGKGETVYCAFLPSLSYFKPATPLKPLDRGSSDDAMSHFIPTEFDKIAGDLIGSIAADLVPPVCAGTKLVECSIIQSDAGTAIIVQNWSGKPVKGLELTLNMPVPTGKAALSSGNKLSIKTDGDKTKLVFDLDVADTVILR